MTRTQKIAAPVTLLIDPDAWQMAYGQFSRQDVLSHIQTVLQGLITDEGQILEVSVKGA